MSVLSSSHKSPSLNEFEHSRLQGDGGQRNGGGHDSPPQSPRRTVPKQPKTDPSIYSLYGLPKRINGFEQPFHTQQKLVWLVGGWTLVTMFAVILPFIPRSGETEKELWSYLAIYLGLILTAIPCYIRTQQIDPALTAQEAQPHAQHLNHGHKGHHHDDVDSARICEKCNLWMGPRTKHCHLCRKCVSGFDHHCLYLNTCIGDKNYHYFFATISSTSLALALQFGVTISILVRAGRSDTNWIGTITDSALTRAGYIVLLVLMAIIPFIFLCLITSLLAFHIHIWFRQQTTYEWILESRKRKADADLEREAQERSVRSVELSRSRQEIEQEWKRQRAAEAAKKNKRLATGGHVQLPSITAKSITTNNGSKHHVDVTENGSKVVHAVTPNLGPRPQPHPIQPADILLSINASPTSIEDTNHLSPSAVTFHVRSHSPDRTTTSGGDVVPSAIEMVNGRELEERKESTPEASPTTTTITIEEPDATLTTTAASHPEPLSPNTHERLAVTADETIAHESANPILTTILDMLPSALHTSHAHATSSTSNLNPDDGTMVLPLPPHMTEYSESAPEPIMHHTPGVSTQPTSTSTSTSHSNRQPQKLTHTNDDHEKKDLKEEKSGVYRMFTD